MGTGNKGKKVKIGLAVLVIIVVGFIAYRHFFAGDQGGGQGGPGGPGGNANVSVVLAAKPGTGNIELTTGLTGTVEAEDTVYVYAKAAGDVTTVYINAGDYVEAGQLLLEIDTEQVESAKNSMDSAAVSLSEAQSDLARMQILYAGGDISAQEYEQYANSVKSAQLQYESAKLNYDYQVKYSQITSPIDGKVEDCAVEVYDRVSQNEQLLIITSEGDKKVSFYVTQRMMANISVGDALDIQKDGVTYAATITEISSIVDETTGLFKVKAILPDAGAVATGSVVKLNLVTDHTENAMVVPVDAIYYSGGEAYVYVYVDGIVHVVDVEVGIYDSEICEILGGLDKDDMVVSTWSSNLYEGATVQLRDESATDVQETPDEAQGGPEENLNAAQTAQ